MKEALFSFIEVNKLQLYRIFLPSPPFLHHFHH